MTSIDTPSNAAILAGKVRLPDNVVYRAFVKETVVLNLQTGKYHGLNPVGGRMLELLERSPTVAETVRLLASEYGRAVDEIAADVCDFCRSLLDRGLIEIHQSDGNG